MYRTTSQINSIMNALDTWFPQYFTRVELPERSRRNQRIYALKMRFGGDGERRGVLMLGGTHARELMNPDALIELAVDLLVSHANNADLVYGGRTWAAAEVSMMLETLELWFVPVVNPDGRDYVLTDDDMWRKNRRNNPGRTCDGVDLNRNADLVWGVIEGAVSCEPCSDVYCGPYAFSEPEARNVKFLLDTQRVDCFVDVHSYSELVLYPWGHAPTQTSDPSMNFLTLPTGTCSPLADPAYAEYMLPRDLERYETVSQQISNDVAAVRGRNYVPQTGEDLYPTTGTLGDYPYSRHLADPSLRKTYSFTFETGPWQGSARESFHPADPDLIKVDAKAGLVSLIHQCICAIELIGHSFFDRDDEVRTLREARDNRLASTEAGQEWIALFERVQTPAIVAMAKKPGVAKSAAQLVRRASKLVAAEGGRLTPNDVKKGKRLLDDLSALIDSPTVKTDLGAVRHRIDDLTGLSSNDAIKLLMKRPPPKPKRQKKIRGD